jgi:predicted O-methyltransferase YrrM
MKISTSTFNNLLQQASVHAQTYIMYSPTQIERGDHLKNDITTGERAWSIPETTGRFLYSLITNLEFRTVLELGTSIGYSTLWIAAGLDEQKENAQMITIEKNPNKSEIAQNTLGKHFPFIHFHSGIIGNYLPMISDSTKFDLIFMDADRGNYQEYWNYLKHFLHQKSIVVIDNALRNQKSVIDFQDFIRADTTLISYLHHLDNGLFIIARADSGYDLYELIITPSQPYKTPRDKPRGISTV